VYENGVWKKGENITADLRSDGDLHTSSLSADGMTLFLSKEDGLNSDIVQSTFDGKKWSEPASLNSNINTPYWESHAAISEDGKYLVFSSSRPGGFGGMDLYISHFENGEWSAAENLGPTINTVLNEDCPTLIHGLNTLIFTSQGHKSMGGYDFFRSEKMGNGQWSAPQNMGYPFNTADDNLYFSPIGTGKTGLVSIYRETEGEGKDDVYKITFK
jgi:hypothetical protein